MCKWQQLHHPQESQALSHASEEEPRCRHNQLKEASFKNKVGPQLDSQSIPGAETSDGQAPLVAPSNRHSDIKDNIEQEDVGKTDAKVIISGAGDHPDLKDNINA